jgi:hypothetical protein
MNSMIDDRPQADHGRTDADTGKSHLGNRCIDDPALRKPLEQSLRHFVGALIVADFFSHEEDRLIAIHLF